MPAVARTPRSVRRPTADATRARILQAALELFAERSFDGAATREIAERAGVSQPSLNYHFDSKLDLWRAAVDELFAALGAHMGTRMAGLGGVDQRTRVELMIRAFVEFSAAHPELHRIVTQESKADGERMDWLVERHVRPIYEATTAMFADLAAAGLAPDVPGPFLYYLLTGAAPTIFMLAPECRRLAGIDPFEPAHVATHADAVVRLLLGPRESGSAR